MELTVFVDESGIIAKHENKSCQYFVIALVLTNNPDKLKKVFKKERLKVIKKHSDLLNELTKNREVKALSLSERQKQQIYGKIIEKCSDCVEFGFIVLDNIESDKKFRKVSARTFNYLIQCFFTKYFIKRSSLLKGNDLMDKISFIIDERNVATKAEHSLREYLNISFQFENAISNEEISVKYADSKNYYLLQLVDYLANTMYRKFQKKDPDAEQNIKLILDCMCGNNFFGFPIEVFKKEINTYNRIIIDKSTSS